MSDFLTRLAARAVGAAPVIQPRLPSLFESGAQSQRPIVEVNVQREAENIHHHQTVSPEVRQARINDLPAPITTPVGEVDAAIKPEINRQPLHLELPATQQKEQADSVSQLAATSEISRSSRAAVEASNKASSPQIVERLHETKLEQTIVPRQHESEWPLIQPKVRQLISDRLSELPTLRTRDERSPDKETQLVRPSPPIVTPVPPPRIKPAEVLAREPLSISEAPPPLNVTIGRIDVRAVFTPASQPTRVRDARPAATSLDEYLKKRSGGEPMSNALAIASVTAVLKDLLNNRLIDHNVSATIGNVTVSALSPDRIDTTSLNQTSQLNLFLYQVTPNIGWRNAGLPARNAQGERIANPPLGLNLHYLLTAYGALEFHAEILLGYGMQLFHETPVLTRDAIRTALAPPSPVSGGAGLPAEMQALFTSELAEQFEQIKIIPETLNSEEISRMWTAFQAHYRPTAAYQASVVLIESKQVTKSVLPVQARKIYAVPFMQPFIDEIKSQAKPGDPILSGQPITTGSNLVIAGRNLKADHVFLKFGAVEKAPLEATSDQLILPVPNELPAGVQGLQVIHLRDLGSPPSLHRTVESNLAAFVLRPAIDPPSMAFTPGGGPAISGSISLTADPPIGDLQRVSLLLNELVSVPPPPLTSPPAEVLAQAYSFVAPSRVTLSPPSGPPTSHATISIPITGVKAGTYLVRLQVDGAESVLQTDAGGQFVGPKVTIA